MDAGQLDNASCHTKTDKRDRVKTDGQDTDRQRKRFKTAGHGTKTDRQRRRFKRK